MSLLSIDENDDNDPPVEGQNGLFGLINPDWQNGPVLTDDQLAALRNSPQMWAMGLGDLTQPPADYLAGFGLTADPLFAIDSWSPATASGPTNLPAFGGTAAGPIFTDAPQSDDDADTPADDQGDEPISDPDSGDTGEAPPPPGRQVAAAQASQPPSSDTGQAGDSGDDSAGSPGDTQPYQVKPMPVTFDQIEPQLQAEMPNIPMPKLPGSSAPTRDSYQPLLDVLKQGEGANYQSIYKLAKGEVDLNPPKGSFDPSQHTIAEVHQYQLDHPYSNPKLQGQQHRAMGAYQFKPQPLIGLAQELNLDPDKTVMDAKTQDALAIQNIRDQHRGRGGETKAGLMANLRRQWDGLNHGRVSSQDFSAAVDALTP